VQKFGRGKTAIVRHVVKPETRKVSEISPACFEFIGLFNFKGVLKKVDRVIFEHKESHRKEIYNQIRNE
jgi:uncharacterized membrane protein